jgi:signal transduction histidine kinase
VAENKRRIILINPGFQIRFSFYVCLMVFLASVIYPWTIYEVFAKIISELSATAPEIAAKLSDQRENLITVLVLFHLGMTGLIFIICIIFSHKIAGPIYKTRQILSIIRDGNLNERLSFRGGDYFPELAEDFNETFDEIQENYKNDFVYLSEVNAYLNNLALVVPDDKKVVLNEISQKLNEMQAHFNETEE